MLATMPSQSLMKMGSTKPMIMIKSLRRIVDLARKNIGENVALKE